MCPAARGRLPWTVQTIAPCGRLRDDSAMGRGSDIRVSALALLFWCWTPIIAEAGYRFDDGVYLGSAELMADWADTLQRAEAQAAALQACLAMADDCSPRLRGVATLIERARDLPADRQLHLINRYINRKRYRGDRRLSVDSRVADAAVVVPSRWATLTEFLERGGDCEDYATSKYQLLRLLGMPAAALRVVVVYDRAAREHHAVLAVRRDDGSAWLLDSDDRIYRRGLFGYRFVYALNETSIWDHEAGPAGHGTVDANLEEAT